MRKIEFIAPVAAMRGNLSGKQSLVYAENDNPAFDAPNGRQYAKNYGPRFIGAKRSSDGKTYFAVKTKSAVKISPMFRKQNALLAASSEIANVCMHNLSLIQGLTDRYKQTAPEGWSFKRWLMSVIRKGLENKQHFAFSGTTLGALFVGNPYISTAIPAGGTDISALYSKRLLAKFWMQLADDPIFVVITGLGQVVAHAGNVWSDVIGSHYNVLGLSADASNYVKASSLFVWDGEEYVLSNAALADGDTFELTSETPA